MKQDGFSKLTKYMPEVQKYQKALEGLSDRWDLLTILGQMSNIDMDMSETRKEFERLTELLLEKLGEERLKKIAQEMSAKARVAVDIVIRNLYERTADIGFLATDNDICAYLKALREEPSIEPSELQRRSSDLRNRFKEYVAKYSVYDNIVLFDTQGKILLQLNPQNDISESDSPFIQEALTTHQEYVEYFGYTDLKPSSERTLVYAYKVTENGEPDDEVLGGLALFFKFEDEMKGVFANLLSPDDWMTITLLNSQGEVISSSDPYEVPIGAPMQKALEGNFKVVRFAGREYLAKTSKTSGYQGYFGLDWMGHVMIPLEHAFECLSDEDKNTIDSKVLETVIRNSSLFGEELETIPKEAEKIQKELDVTVWNGNVKIANSKLSDNSFSRSLLFEISKTGQKTKQVFEESIGNLNNTVISSILSDGEFLAKLAIDIMDRNLYERANDCRWWALTTFFRQTLKTEQPDQERMSSILQYINHLYTVYTNLFIYDKNGVVQAVSNPEKQNLVGMRLNESWVSQTLSLTDSQKYTVSDFKPTSLYDGKSTYIYGASITDIDNPNEVLGGIGIVFDSTPELQAILSETLPSSEESYRYFGLFCDNEKTVISSTSDEIKVGEQIEIDDRFFQLESGQSMADIIPYGDKYYSVGVSVSKGYREYKVKDDYRNDVVSLVFSEIAKYEEEQDGSKVIERPTYSYPRPQPGEETIDVSTFVLAGKVYAVESKYVVSSLSNQPLTNIVGSDDFLIGVVNYKKYTISVVSLFTLITKEPFHYDPEEHDIILLNLGEEDGQNRYIGMAVDAIYDSAEIGVKDIQEYNSNSLTKNSLTKYIVKPDQEHEKTEMLSVLDIHKIYQKLVG